jgi:ferritin
MKQNLVDEINNQIKYEFFSAQLYLAMASFCKERDYDGFESWFMVQYQEEHFHAMKFYRYLHERGAKVEITGFEDPRVEYANLKHVFEYGISHEKMVTQRINKLMDIATVNKDYAAIQFLQWFINEQVEEEDSFRSMHNKIKMVGEVGEGMYHLDKEAAMRVFTPPAN